LLLLEKVEPVACSPMESRLTKISRVETRARELKKQSQSSSDEQKVIGGWVRRRS